MDLVYRRCCGLDVHKHSVVACLVLLDEAGRKQQKHIVIESPSCPFQDIREPSGVP